MQSLSTYNAEEFLAIYKQLCMQVYRSGYSIINRVITYTFLSRLVLKGPWAEMERRNLKDDMLASDLKSLFNAYKEHLNFRAASLKA